jgi:hypothetical protein
VREADIEAAWADLRARWSDDAAHRALLDRFSDLDGLAAVGGRYREALDAQPGDPVAARWRDEVLKRATALALSQLPRTAPSHALSPRARKALLLAVLVASVGACAWVFLRWMQVVSR